MGSFLADVPLAVFWQNHEFCDTVTFGEVFGVGIDHGKTEELVAALFANEEGEALRFGEVTVKPLIFKDSIVCHFVAVGGTFFEKGILQEAIKAVFFVWGNSV